MVIDPLGCDLYALDDNGNPNIDAFVEAGPPWHVLTFKATEGTYYPGSAKRQEWFLQHWLPARIKMGVRYGVDLWRQCYHYFRVDEDALVQANNCLELVEEAGGFGPGDLPVMVDVENAENPPNAPNSQIIDGLSLFASRIITATGRAPILYAGAYIRDKKITDHMSCQAVHVAEYSSELSPHIYKDMGWDFPIAWQFEGTDGYSGPTGYPRVAPVGSGPADISAYIVNGGGDRAIEWMRANALS